MTRVLLVDDHPVLRTGVAAILATFPDIDVVGSTGDPEAVTALVAETIPDVVVLDLGLGTRNGVDLIPDLIRSTRVLVFTATGTDVAIMRALDAGATGYLLKDASADELAAAVRAAATGTAVYARAVAERMLDRGRRPDETLTPRELDVLELLADGSTNRVIAGQLFMSESTVKTHLVRVFAKLGVDGRAGAVAEATRRGIIAFDGQARPARSPDDVTT
ncbi:response regulator [Curtobacterium aurantiacum]|uniref:response regulator n=1 Tax=Curtobacterium aurantiacum TaxID=3236919 RepID=UPI001BE0A00A|nr:response regulator transcription factor [Curtobacterium flaccumfaciens]MBT1676534.1 response regulator transcription factor [Curtobacterium flaccumfaciens pv. flaccumfaciens]